MEIKKFFCKYWKIIVTWITPVALSPLIFATDTQVCYFENLKGSTILSSLGIISCYIMSLLCQSKYNKFILSTSVIEIKLEQFLHKLQMYIQPKCQFPSPHR